MKRLVLVAAIVALAFAQTARADLKVGDKAPKLTISKWVKGDKVDLSKAKPKDIYVVEFWATWCGPCLAGMPHLSELQDHFKDKNVTIIGVTDEKKKVVRAFLKSGWDAKMRYTVAVDKKGKTNKAWMKAAKQQGIPTAFIVNKGTIQWIGHPAEPSFDLKIAELAGDKEYAANIKKFAEKMEQFSAAMQGEKWEEALKAADDVLAIKPKESQVTFMKYFILATMIKDAEKAAAFGKKLVKSCDEPQTLNRLAWGLLMEKEFEGARDIKLALKGAKKAMKLTEKKDASIIDTYARALAMSGDLKGAIKWQKKAIKACENENLTRELKKALTEYREKAASKDADA